MKLGIVGTGAMGQVLYEYALQEGTFDEIFLIEPTEQNPWPQGCLDLIIDFSHPSAIQEIYQYCLEEEGNIPVVLATTGYGMEEELVIRLLERICPVVRKSNFSRGMAVMEELCKVAAERFSSICDIRLSEIHHTKKKDTPSGSAINLCKMVGVGPNDSQKVQSLRMGTVFGEHTVYFALEDEVLEIKHTALSKKIFAIGALEAGKKLINLDLMG